MKNQYFGDVNDYRKYGLLRLLGGQGSEKIGVCWMLTPNDSRPDGEKTDYLDPGNESTWEHFDAPLYCLLRRKVHGHETEPKSRDVKHFTEDQLPNAQFYLAHITDNADERNEYFHAMWELFEKKHVDLIFFIQMMA